MTPEQRLACAIFEQAIEDYKTLKRNKKEVLNDRFRQKYSIKDIEYFFKSKWCSRLLDVLDTNLNGMDILKKIQTQAVVKGRV